MNVLDIVLLACFIPAIIEGLRKGFISQVVGIVAIVLGGWLAYKFSSLLSTWISSWLDASPYLLEIIAFIIIFILVTLGLFALGKLLEATVKIILLGWLNKLLGLIFAILKYGLIIGLLIIVFNTVNDKFELVPNEYLNASHIYVGLKQTAYSVFPYLKEMLFK